MPHFARNRNIFMNYFFHLKKNIPNTDDCQQKIILSSLIITKSHHEKAEGFCGDPVAVTSEMPVTSKMFVFLDGHTSLRWFAMTETIGFYLPKSRIRVFSIILSFLLFFLLLKQVIVALLLIHLD